MSNIQIRRGILKLLYDAHDLDPFGAIEQDELTQKLGLPSSRVRSNLMYLSQKGLVDLKRTFTGGNRVYSFVQITAASIDLLNDPNEFNAKFPSQVVYQHIAGDSLEVTIGDNASEVIVGKDITKLQFGADHSLEETSVQVVGTASEKTSEQVDRATLRQILTTYFNESELRNLCFDLGVDYDNLPGEGKGDKARELVALFERCGRPHELVEACQRLRPNVSW